MPVLGVEDGGKKLRKERQSGKTKIKCSVPNTKHDWVNNAVLLVNNH